MQTTILLKFDTHIPGIGNFMSLYSQAKQKSRAYAHLRGVSSNPAQYKQASEYRTLRTKMPS